MTRSKTEPRRGARPCCVGLCCFGFPLEGRVGGIPSGSLGCRRDPLTVDRDYTRGRRGRRPVVVQSSSGGSRDPEEVSNGHMSYDFSRRLFGVSLFVDVLVSFRFRGYRAGFS